LSFVVHKQCRLIDFASHLVSGKSTEIENLPNNRYCEQYKHVPLYDVYCEQYKHVPLYDVLSKAVYVCAYFLSFK